MCMLAMLGLITLLKYLTMKIDTKNRVEVKRKINREEVRNGNEKNEKIDERGNTIILQQGEQVVIGN